MTPLDQSPTARNVAMATGSAAVQWLITRYSRERCCDAWRVRYQLQQLQRTNLSTRCIRSEAAAILLRSSSSSSWREAFVQLYSIPPLRFVAGTICLLPAPWRQPVTGINSRYLALVAVIKSVRRYISNARKRKIIFSTATREILYCVNPPADDDARWPRDL